MALDRPSAQVAIEATIAEVSLNNDLQYGVQVFLKSETLGAGRNKGSIGIFQAAGSAALSRVLPGFNLLLGSETDPRLIIDALRGVTEVKVLSTPSVVVMDNKSATLQVGDEIPIVTRTAQSVTDPDAPVVNNVEFRNTGVILKVLPKITANGTINLVIEQEISSVAPGDAATLTPTISKRRISSTVSVTSGQTVLLGGLVSERQQRGRSGVPVLGDLPLIGDAFRTNKNAATRTELIVLIRPQVIRDSLDAQQIAEEMRSQLLLDERTVAQRAAQAAGQDHHRMTRRPARRYGLLIGTPFLAAVVLPALGGRPVWVLVAGVALCVVAVAIAVHDLTSMLIPDRYTAGLAVIAALALLADDATVETVLMAAALAAAIGAALFAIGLAYSRIRGFDGIGFGDVKLLAASAMLVGPWGIGVQLVLATTAALVFVVIRSVRRGRPLRATTRIPFGAFLAPSAVIVWAWFPVA